MGLFEMNLSADKLFLSSNNNNNKAFKKSFQMDSNQDCTIKLKKPNLYLVCDFTSSEEFGFKPKIKLEKAHF